LQLASTHWSVTSAPTPATRVHRTTGRATSR